MTFHGINDKLYFDDNNKIGIGITNPSTDFHINSTDGIVIPVGTDAQRVNVIGAIRYNTDNSTFEGYKGTWGSLGGVIDVDQDTYVSAETSAGTDNDQLKFVTAGSEKMLIDSSGISLKCNIIPDTNDAYDIGSPEFKIRDMYVADNSLWVGDTHKVSITSSGKLKFRKRRVSSVPPAVTAAGGTESAALTHSGESSLINMKLKHWKAYMRSLSGQSAARIQDIFRDNDDDYDEQVGADNWLENNTHTYCNIGNVGIGTDSPSYKLDVNGTGRFTGDITGNLVGNVTGDITGDVTGTIITASQSNITSVGTLTSLNVTGQMAVGDIDPYIFDEGGSSEIPFELTVKDYIKVDEVDNDAGSIYFGNGITNGIFVSSAQWNINTDRPLYSFNGSSLNVRIKSGNLGIDMGNTLPTINLAISDVDTGLNSEGTDELAIYTGGNERMRFDSSGNVGIGTDSPLLKLHVSDGSAISGTNITTGTMSVYGSSGNQTFNVVHPNQTQGISIGFGEIRKIGTSNSLLTLNNPFASDLVFKTNDTEAMRIDSGGNVGIGTDNPLLKLHIYEATTSTANKMRFSGIDSAATGADIGYDSINNFEIRNSENTEMEFFTNNVERMVIDENGNVGIGTTDPQELLHIQSGGTGSSCPSIRIQNTLSGGSGTHVDTEYGSIDFWTSDGNNAIGRIVCYQDGGGTSPDCGLKFYVNENSTQTEAMYLKYNGNVGIGTDSPECLLHLSAGTSGDCVLFIQSDTANTSGEEGENPRILFGQDAQTLSNADGAIGKGYDNDNELFLSNGDGDIVFYTNGSNWSDGTERMRIDKASGNFGIGVTNQACRLHIKSSASQSQGSIEGGASTKAQLILSNSSNDSVALAMHTGATTLGFHFDDNAYTNFIEKAYIKGDTDVNQLDFTGQHRNILNKNIDQNSIGLIVCSTGKYVNLDNSVQSKINESLPICSLASTDNDIKVFGVISNKEDINDKREYGHGAFITPYEKQNKNEQRMFINSLGEGGIWVCNKNGTIVNGDYISSSSVVGYGQKQTLNLNTLMNHTVAKITCDCDFNLTKVVKQKVKVLTSTETFEKIVTEEVQETVTETEIVYDETSGQYREQEIITTETNKKTVYEIVNLYDSNGNELFNDNGTNKTYQFEKKETVTKTIYNLVYDSNGDIEYEDDLDINGQQQMEYEYDNRFLNADGTLIATEAEYNTKKENGENVYIAQFVGCTYHCG